MTNEELVRKYYVARSEGLAEDFWREHVAENVAYHLPARTTLGGDFHGKAEVRKALAAIGALSGGTFKLQLLDVTSSSIHAIALVRATAQRQGKVLDSRQAHVFEIVDGRIVSIWNYAYDRYAIDAFWN
jgi:ketosteroid isomerase-like protein